jgi:hypothetical protein
MSGFSSNLLITLLIDTIPFSLCERSEHDAHVDEVKLFMPRPILLDVVDFKHAIGGHPRDWWRK